MTNSGKGSIVSGNQSQSSMPDVASSKFWENTCTFGTLNSMNFTGIVEIENYKSDEEIFSWGVCM